MLRINGVVHSTDWVVKRLPGHREGATDGRRGVGVLHRQRYAAELGGAAEARLAEIHEPKIRTMEVSITAMESRIAEVEAAINAGGAPPLPLWKAILLLAVIVLAVAGETGTTMMGFAIFGAKGPWLLLMALPVILGASAFTKCLASLWEQGNNLLTVLLAPLVPVGIAALIHFRLGYLKLVEIARYPDGKAQQLLDGYGMSLVVMLGVFTAIFAIVSAMIWRRVSESITVHGRKLFRVLLKAKLFGLLRKKAREEVIFEKRREQLQKLIGAASAEYSLGVEVGQMRASRWDGFDPVRGMLTIVAVGGCAALLAIGLTVALWARAGTLGLVISLLVGIVALAVVMLNLLPTLRRDAKPTQLKLPFPAAGLFLLLLLPLQHGCMSPTQESGRVIVILDVTRSVLTTDADFVVAASVVLAHLPSCWEMSVLPVNGNRGQGLSMRLPCEVEAFGDNFEAEYREFRARLPDELAKWRKHDRRSDYISAMTLAGELLDGASPGGLVVLGDLVQDVGDKPTTPVVPSLGDLRLSGVKVYLGFLESIELAKVSPQKQKSLLDGWKASMMDAGADEVVSRQFGLHGLEDWCQNVLGPATETYAAFAISTTGGGK